MAGSQQLFSQFHLLALVKHVAHMHTTGTTPDGWYIYTGEIHPTEAGRFGFTVRILPHHPLLLDSHSLGLIRWAQVASA